ncbi:autotransporter outer membrane beta-barrel domain-containing protein [Achromobacter xylosoxidans]
MTPQLAVQPQASASRPAAASWRNVSPESGAYIGNQLASAAFFTHGQHDRVPSCGACGEARDAATESGASYRGIWTRVQGRQDSGLRMAEGRVGIERSSQIVQLGGDLLTAPLGGKGAVHLGLMGGYGSARSTSTSSLALPGGTMAQARARGKVSGYSAGVYGTYYQEDASRMGAYVDGWLQYDYFNNRIDSELGSARYDSTVWSASAKPAMRSSLSPSVRRWGRSLSSRTSSWSTATTMRRMPCCKGPAWAQATPAPGTRMPACACIPRPLRARRRCVRSWNWIGCTASIRRPCGWGPTRWPPRPRATAWN